MSQSRQQVQILMMPDYRQDNPYQQLLVQAIEQHGVGVSFPQGYRRIFPIFRAAVQPSNSFKILHLHWLETYLKGNNRFTKYLYAIKFIIDVLLTRCAGIKIIWSIHDQLEHDTKFPRLELWVRKTLARLADRLILHNRSTLEIISQQFQFDVGKAAVIPHGHYQGVYGSLIDRDTARQKLGLPLQGRIYLNLGMLRPYKGIEHLLQVWQENQKDLAGNTLLIAGKPIDPEYSQQLTNLITGIDNVAFYPKFIESSEIYLFFSAADIVVLPYKNILTSGSVILAMSYAKPVIAPRLGSIPEVLGTADPLLYDASEKQGLAQALQKSVHCGLLKLSERTDEACKSLEWRPIGEKTVQIYQQCLSQKEYLAANLTSSI